MTSLTRARWEATEQQQVDWIRASGFRLRGAHTGKHYAPQMKLVQDAITAFLADGETVKVLGNSASSVRRTA